MKKPILFLLLSLSCNVSLPSTKIEPFRIGPVELVWHTPQPEKTSCHIALLTSLSKSIDSITRFSILEYCLKNQHWSAFEHAFMTLRIYTSRAISLQLLRHQSFRFQQYSQRYGNTANIIDNELPMPDLRQVKGELDSETKKELQKEIRELFSNSLALYKKLIGLRIKTECARFVLPEITPTIVNMTGNIRSWIHFIERCSTSRNQPEMVVVANACKEMFEKIFPHTFGYLKLHRPQWGWN